MDKETADAIGALTARCEALDARVAAMAAFAAAVLKDHPHRDLLQTRWGDYLGPALLDLGPGLEPQDLDRGASVPGWVASQINKPAGTL
ncbi:hypothetical protein [Ramlibacter sp.]|uniref:hypothetical protein n=1 Tax=Ramlibacter sp. TaxID=1917967 RepID=UPI003D09DABB